MLYAFGIMGYNFTYMGYTQWARIWLIYEPTTLMRETNRDSAP